MEMIDRINLIMKEKSVSKTKLGEKLGQSKQNVGYRLKNNQVDSVEFIKAVCDLAETTFEYIVYGVEECKYLNIQSLVNENKALKEDNTWMKGIIKQVTGIAPNPPQTS
jgi:DNA-binding Xre family transcriptional regulator